MLWLDTVRNDPSSNARPLSGLGRCPSRRTNNQVRRRCLPGVCTRVACEVLRDADRFLLSVAAADMDGETGGAFAADDGGGLDDEFARMYGQEGVYGYGYGDEEGALGDVASHWLWG